MSIEDKEFETRIKEAKKKSQYFGNAIDHYSKKSRKSGVAASVPQEVDLSKRQSQNIQDYAYELQRRKMKIEKTTPADGQKAKSNLVGVTSRLDKDADWNDRKTYLFVGPLSTRKEKILKMRADIINNQKGLKSNGATHQMPSAKAMENILKRKASENGKEARASRERLKSACRPSQQDIKFKYRDDLRNNLQKTSQLIQDEYERCGIKR